MDRFSGLSLLIKTAELGSFSAVARHLGRTHAAVGKQIAELEKSLGVQLLVRTTRRLALTEAGESLIRELKGSVERIEQTLATLNPSEDVLTGTLRVNLAPAFGRQYIMPLMGPFLEAHPRLHLDWSFENRQVNLIAEGFDAGISGGFELNDSFIARKLAPLHLVLVAAPDYLKTCGLALPKTPEDLKAHRLIAMRSTSTRLIRPWQLRSLSEAFSFLPEAQLSVNEPEVVKEAALAGFGIGLSGMAHCAEPLAKGDLIRLLPEWWSDLGHLSLYYPATKLRPKKTTAFVDYLTQSFTTRKIAKRLDARP